MEPVVGETRQQGRVFLIVSFLFFGDLLLFCIHLARSWQSLDHSLQSEASCLAIASLVLWLQLRSEKASGFTITMAFAVLLMATQLALHRM
jgi:hypothetical protein